MLIESSHATPERGPPGSIEDGPGRTVVRVTGDHDTSTVSDLSALLAQAISLDDTDLVVDLGGVRFMDVSTLRVIMRAREFLIRRGRSLRLRSPSPCALLVLDSCGMTALVSPGPVVAEGPAGAGAALASWVDVPRTDLSTPATAPRALEEA